MLAESNRRNITEGEAQADLVAAFSKLREMLGVLVVRTRQDHDAAALLMDEIMDIIGEDENHPLQDLLHILASQIEAYEDEHVQIPDAEPREVLRYLMEEHGLKQTDLSDCMPQNRVSEVLSGERKITVDAAKKLAQRFKVSTDVFL